MSEIKLNREPDLKRTTLTLCLTWAILFLLCDTGFSATYYFSQSGDDSNSGVTSQAPWRRLGKIFQLGASGKIKPGDEFLLKRGDAWSASEISVGAMIRLKKINGDKKARIVIGAYGNGKHPILSAAGVEATHVIIRLDDVHNITIRDLHLIGGRSTRRFIKVNGPSSYLKFLNIYFDNTKENQFNAKAPKQSRYWGDGLFFPDAGTHNIEVGHCRFTGIGGMPGEKLNKADGICVVKPKSAFWIHENKLLHCNEGIDVAGGKNHLIENNIIVRASEYQGIKLHSQASHLSDTVIRGNIIIEATGFGIALENISNCEMYNNTIYKGRYGAMALGDYQEGIYHGTFEKNRIQNNIFYGMVNVYGKLPTKNIGLTNTFSHNLFFNPSAPTLIFFPKNKTKINKKNFNSKWRSRRGVSGDKAADPRFLKPFCSSFDRFGDFHLSRRSPGVGRGNIKGLKGVPFGKKRKIDIGACVFGKLTPKTPSEKR